MLTNDYHSLFVNELIFNLKHGLDWSRCSGTLQHHSYMISSALRGRFKTQGGAGLLVTWREGWGGLKGNRGGFLGFWIVSAPGYQAGAESLGERTIRAGGW